MRVLEAGYQVGSFGYKNQRLTQVTGRNGGLLNILSVLERGPDSHRNSSRALLGTGLPAVNMIFPLSQVLFSFYIFSFQLLFLNELLFLIPHVESNWPS